MVQSAPGWFVGVIKRGRNAPETGVVEIAVSEPGRDDREKFGALEPLTTLIGPLRSPAVMTGKRARFQGSR